MVKSLHISKNKSSFYYRKPIPIDLRKYFKGIEFKRSLRTSDLQEAKSKAKIIDELISAIFTIARSGMLSKEDIKNLIERFETKYRATKEGEREWRIREQQTEEDLDFKIETQKEMVDFYSRRCDERDYKSLEPEVDKLLAEQGFSARSTSAEYIRLALGVLKSIQTVEKEELDYWQETITRQRIQESERRNFFPGGIPVELQETEEVPSTPLVEAASRPESLQPDETHYLNRGYPSITFSEAKDRFVAEKENENPDGHSSHEGYRDTIALFLEIIGDINLLELDDQTPTKFINKLKVLPSRRNILKKYRDKNISQFTEESIPIEDRLSVTTINKHLINISSIFNSFVDNDLLRKNFFKGKQYNRRAKAIESIRGRYQPFTLKELNTIKYNIEVFKNGDKYAIYPERYWITLIGMYCGLRMNEACQLFTSDIKKIDGVWVIDINENHPTKKVKRVPSIRLVPIHPYIIDKGFLSYHKKLERKREERLWPHLTYIPKKGYKDRFEDWFREFRKHVTNEERRSFQSFRKNVNTCLQQRGVTVEVRNKIMGHEQQNIDSDTYWADVGQQYFYEIISRIDY